MREVVHLELRQETGTPVATRTGRKFGCTTVLRSYRNRAQGMARTSALEIAGMVRRHEALRTGKIAYAYKTSHAATRPTLIR